MSPEEEAAWSLAYQAITAANTSASPHEAVGKVMQLLGSHYTIVDRTSGATLGEGLGEKYTDAMGRIYKEVRGDDHNGA